MEGIPLSEWKLSNRLVRCNTSMWLTKENHSLYLLPGGLKRESKDNKWLVPIKREAVTKLKQPLFYKF
jgi:hypothetical protein